MVLERREDFFALFAETRAGLPPCELERLRHVAALFGTCLDHPHPLNSFHRPFLEHHWVNVPDVSLEPSEREALERELQGLKRDRERELVSRYYDRVNYG